MYQSVNYVDSLLKLMIMYVQQKKKELLNDMKLFIERFELWKIS